MAATDTPQTPPATSANAWVFNPPPGWPAAPAGWQPPPGWRPDPAWPPAPDGWNFWRPAAGDVDENGGNGGSAGPATGAGTAGPLAAELRGGEPRAAEPRAAELHAGELRVTVDGQSHVARPGQVLRIGRAPDNDAVVGYPAVSRRHGQLSQQGGGWVFENVGQAPTFLGGQPVTRVAITEPVELTLGSANGPVMRVEPALSPQGAARPRSGGARHGVRPQPVPPPDGELLTAFRILIPVRSWLRNPGWRQGLRLLVIAYALLPLVFVAVFATSGDLAAPGWAYSLYVAPLWAIGFWMLIRPGRVRRLEIWVGAGIILWVLVWINTVTITINDHLIGASRTLSLPAAIAAGYNEEIAKALPVLLAGLILLKFRKTKLDVRMWMFLGTISGLTFGVTEAALYTSREILIINRAPVASEAVGAVLAFAERVFVDGLQHAVWAGIAAFFIGIAVNYPRRRVPLILLGLSIPAVLHGVNDWTIITLGSYWGWITIQAVSLLLFLGYTMSAASIERQVRKTPMFRGESIVMDAFSDPD